jgi:hypothetical protein
LHPCPSVAHICRLLLTTHLRSRPSPQPFREEGRVPAHYSHKGDRPGQPAPGSRISLCLFPKTTSHLQPPPTPCNHPPAKFRPYQTNPPTPCPATKAQKLNPKTNPPAPGKRMTSGQAPLPPPRLRASASKSPLQLDLLHPHSKETP